MERSGTGCRNRKLVSRPGIEATSRGRKMDQSGSALTFAGFSEQQEEHRRDKFSFAEQSELPAVVETGQTARSHVRVAPGSSSMPARHVLRSLRRFF